MNRKIYILFPASVLIIPFLISCSTIPAAPSPTIVSTILPTLTITPTFTISPTIQPTLTPIPIISPNNASKVTQIASLGKGILFHTAWSPDGKLFATSSSIGIFLYNAQTFQEVGNIKTEFPSVFFAFMPDGTTILEESDGGGIFLYRISDGVRVMQFEGGANPVIAISSNGTMIAIKYGKEINLWRVSDGKLLQTLKGLADDVTSITFSPDGGLLAGSVGSYTCIWNVSDGTIKHRIFTLYGYGDIAFSPDGLSLAVRLWKKIEFWRVSDWSYRIAINIPEDFDHFVISPDGNSLATQTYKNGSINIRNISNGDLLFTLNNPSITGHSFAYPSWYKHVNDMEYSPNGKTIAMVANDNSVHLWRVSDGTLQTTLDGFTLPISKMSLSSDGSTLVSISFDGTAYSWQLVNKNLQRDYLISPNFVLSPDGSIIAVCCGRDNSIQIQQISDGAVLKSIKVDIPKNPYAFVHNLSFSHDGSILIVEIVTDNNWDRNIGLWNISETKEIYNFTNGSYALSSDGKLLAITAYKKTLDASSYEDLKLLRVPEGTILFTIPVVRDQGNFDVPFPDVFSPDGTRLFFNVSKLKNISRGVATLSDNMHILNISDGTILNTPDLPNLSGLSLNEDDSPFTPDGKEMLVGGMLFRVSDGSFLHWLKDLVNPSNTPASCSTFSPNGDILALGFEDGTIKLLRISDGVSLITLKGHLDSISKLLFSSDGLNLYSGSKDGTIRIWGVPKEEN
jgi:WD40 repeat protein